MLWAITVSEAVRIVSVPEDVMTLVTTEEVRKVSVLDDMVGDEISDAGQYPPSSPSRLPFLLPRGRGQTGEDKPFHTAFINPAVGPRGQDVLLSRLCTKRDVNPEPGLWREGYRER